MSNLNALNDIDIKKWGDLEMLMDMINDNTIFNQYDHDLSNWTIVSKNKKKQKLVGTVVHIDKNIPLNANVIIIKNDNSSQIFLFYYNPIKYNFKLNEKIKFEESTKTRSKFFKLAISVKSLTKKN